MFNRRLFLLSSAALVSGCGFEPLYSPNGRAQALRGTILVDAPTDKNSYSLVKHLESTLGAPKNPRFGLAYKLTSTIESLAITQAQETTRYNVLGGVTFSLRDLATQEILISGASESFTAFDATSSSVNTRAAKDDAFRRLMVILGDDITEHLIFNAENLQP